MNLLIPSSGRRYLHIKNFKECKGVNKVITTDIDIYSPGIHAADKCYSVPRIDDENYVPILLEICDKEKIDAVIPLLDADILILSRRRELFEEKGIKLLISSKEMVEISMDKLATSKFLVTNGLPSPITILSSELEKKILNFPMLMKPRFPYLRVKSGYDISIITNNSELKKALKAVEGNEENYVLQEYLTGKELSIDFFCDDDGNYLIDVPAYRKSALTTAFSKNGGTMDKGRTFHSEKITEHIMQATKFMKIYGPANFGGYELSSGEIKYTEINARMTGGATLIVKGSGIDLFQWSVDLLSGKAIKVPKKGFEEVYMTSYVMPIIFKKPPVFKKIK